MGSKATIRLTGTVFSRSSKPDAHGPPGEAALAELNPERAPRIMAATGWERLEPGTLNLHVEQQYVDALANVAPLIEEPVANYPPEYQRLARKRGGYWLYQCRLKANGKRVRCLARRARARPCKETLEILAPTRLRDALGLQDGQAVDVKVWGAKRDGVAAEPAPPPPTVTNAPRLRSKHQKWFRGGVWFVNAKTKRPVAIEGLMDGAHAFLVCNGPSLKAIDLNPLRYCWTMGLNNGPKACMPVFRPRMWLSVDGPDKFLYTIWEDPNILKFLPSTHPKKWLWNSDTNAPHGKRVQDCPGVLLWNRSSGFNPDTYLTEPYCCWGNSDKQQDANGQNGRRSCMLAAIKILYVLGFRHVYLVGNDFSMKEGQANYAFDQDRKTSSIRGNNGTYAQLAWRFGELQPRFLAAGFNVFNCTPGSELQAFPFLDYSEAVRRALGYVSSVEDWLAGKLEKTDGLYETKWYVCPECGCNMRLSKEQCRSGAARCNCGRTIDEKDRHKYAKNQDQGEVAS